MYNAANVPKTARATALTLRKKRLTTTDVWYVSIVLQAVKEVE